MAPFARELPEVRKTMRSFIAPLVMSFLLAACTSETPTSDQPEVRLDLTTVVQNSQSGYDLPTRAVIRTTSDWSQAWQTLHRGLNPGPPIPAVDFDREMLVLAAAGERSDGCYSIEVTRATLKGDGSLEFEVTETVPGPNCICTQAITQPVHVAKLSRAQGAARYVESQRAAAC